MQSTINKFQTNKQTNKVASYVNLDLGQYFSVKNGPNSYYCINTTIFILPKMWSGSSRLALSTIIPPYLTPDFLDFEKPRGGGEYVVHNNNF